MVERHRPKRRIMREFMIKELSAVDQPAQGHARAVLMKRADDPAKSYDSYPQAEAMCAVEANIEAMDFEEVLAEQQSREAAQRVKDCVWSKWHALQRSFDTIAGDDDVAPDDKVSQMKESLGQFLDAVREESEAIAEEITKSMSAAPALADLLPSHSEGDEPMTDAEKKQIADLQKKVDELTKQLDAASAKEPAKKAAELEAELQKAEGVASGRRP